VPAARTGLRAGLITIPISDISVAVMRSGGPGGQNVNKVATAVQLRFALQTSTALEPRVKQRLRQLAGSRLLDDGSLLIVAREHRSQEQNRREAEERLIALIETALIEPRQRRATRPTRASKERRLESKVKRASTKKGRGRVRSFD